MRRISQARHRGTGRPRPCGTILHGRERKARCLPSDFDAHLRSALPWRSGQGQQMVFRNRSNNLNYRKTWMVNLHKQRARLVRANLKPSRRRGSRPPAIALPARRSSSPKAKPQRRSSRRIGTRNIARRNGIESVRRFIRKPIPRGSTRNASRPRWNGA